MSALYSLKHHMLDTEKELTAKISDIDHSYNDLAKIKISIYLIDF
jgi:hypothetical protein